MPIRTDPSLGIRPLAFLTLRFLFSAVAHQRPCIFCRIRIFCRADASCHSQESQPRRKAHRFHLFHHFDPFVFHILLLHFPRVRTQYNYAKRTLLFFFRFLS
ncbi:MAG: BC10 family protein [Firmicutes bacterium]|nr:BC10 family protein [Bacillota bacterium]